MLTENKNEHMVSSGTGCEEIEEKEIEDYPQPLAVVGASVL